MQVNDVSNKPPESAPAAQDSKLRSACEDFEALFMNQLLKSMRKTVVKSELMGSNRQEELFQDLMDAEVCRAAAKTSSVGIADMLYRQLSAGMQSPNLNETRGEGR